MDRDALRREVKDLLATGLRLQVGAEEIPDDEPIFGEALGLDSIDALELVVLVEDRFHVSIPDEEVGRRAFGSVNALVDFILAERAGSGGGCPAGS
jgi:acyl carrier protein